MNILFFFANAIIKSSGGVENVTAFWYDYFRKHGHNVYIIYWRNNSDNSPIIPQVGLPNKDNCNSHENIKFFNDFIIDNNINIVINQSGLNNRTSSICTEGCKNSSAKLISVIHNTPFYFIKSKPLLAKLDKIKFISNAIRQIYSFANKNLYHYNGNYQYINSNAIVVLSPNYKKEYEFLNIKKKKSEIVSIPNPLTLKRTFEKVQKENIALFVGRLTPAKGLDRLIQSWEKIQHKIPEWKLYIVGDGPLRPILQQKIKKRGIQNIIFTGNTNPEPYYIKAKIFCMTSRFEGLPMTLIECQFYGVVPIIMDSYAAAKDIVKNGYNGFITSESINEYSKKLYRLILEENEIIHLSKNCLQEVKKYSPEIIYRQYETLFKSITSKNET